MRGGSSDLWYNITTTNNTCSPYFATQLSPDPVIKHYLKLGILGNSDLYLIIPKCGYTYLQLSQLEKEYMDTIRVLLNAQNVAFLQLEDFFFIITIDIESLKEVVFYIEKLDGYKRLKNIDEAIEECIIGELKKE